MLLHNQKRPFAWADPMSQNKLLEVEFILDHEPLKCVTPKHKGYAALNFRGK
jgi:hypothetical protein